jgi:23S rRNA pseudouridine1911/1915/1917 synthase
MPSIFRRDCTYKKQSAIANCGQKHDFIVPDESAKQRLDVFLASMLTQHSRSFVSDLCENGKVTVNEKPRAKNHKVIKGDKVCVDIDIVEDQSEVQPENIALDILYEDNDIIAINKPNGMVVHPAPGSPNGTFVNALLFHLGDEAQKLLIDAAKVGGNSLLSEEEDDILVDLPETPEAATASPQALRPGIVHRLDKGTSGVLLAGKHPEAVAKLSALFAQRKVRKVYLAVCVGHPGDTTIFEPIGRSQKNRQLMTVYDGPPGKPALTHVRTLAFDGKLSAALVRIETGRCVHQQSPLRYRVLLQSIDDECSQSKLIVCFIVSHSATTVELIRFEST